MKIGGVGGYLYLGPLYQNTLLYLGYKYCFNIISLSITILVTFNSKTCHATYISYHQGKGNKLFHLVDDGNIYFQENCVKFVIGDLFKTKNENRRFGKLSLLTMNLIRICVWLIFSKRQRLCVVPLIDCLLR